MRRISRLKAIRSHFLVAALPAASFKHSHPRDFFVRTCCLLCDATCAAVQYSNASLALAKFNVLQSTPHFACDLCSAAPKTDLVVVFPTRGGRYKAGGRAL